MEQERASWLEVSASALRLNVRTFARAIGAQRALGVVVKANAYGHGLAEVVRSLPDEAAWLFTITAGDGLVVRGVAPTRQVLVLGATGADEAVALAEGGVHVVLGDDAWQTWVPALRAAGVKLRAHVHIDSGLGREGWAPEALPGQMAALGDVDDVIEVVAVMTHFADTEDVTHQAYAMEQLRRFALGREVVERALGRAVLGHAAASAAALVLPESRLDLVRVGISLYGLWPSVQTRISAAVAHEVLPELAPVLSWRVRAQHVKFLDAGEFVGYGCTHRCRDRTRVAVLPVGYFDGYPRSLSGRAHVLVRGRRCPVLGRVMMNHLIVDITGVPGGEEEVVATLIGADGEEMLSAEQLADWAGTISYEIVARLGAHLARRVIP